MVKEGSRPDMGTTYNEKHRGGMVWGSNEYNALGQGTHGLKRVIGSSYAQH